MKSSKMEVDAGEGTATDTGDEVASLSGSTSSSPPSRRHLHCDPTLVLDTVHRSTWGRIASDRLTLHYSYAGGGMHTEDYAAARAVRPCRPGSLLCYYEATIIECDDESGSSDFCIGFGSERFSLNHRVGSGRRSFGMLISPHIKERSYYSEESLKHSFCQRKLKRGDVFGCGINFETRSMFFTKNGELFENGSEKFVDEVKGKLYPIVSVHGKDDVLRVNFGAEKFLFDTDSFQTRVEDVRAAEVNKVQLPGDSTVSRIIQSYLLWNGYQDTLKNFSRESKTEEDSNDMKWKTLAIRAEIRTAILAGDIDTAIAKVASIGNGDLARRPRLMYPLHCMQFIELVRNGRIADAVLFSRTTMAQYDREQVQDVLALLTNADPSKSLGAHLLEDYHKAKVAETVNSLILESFSINPVAPLSTALRHMVAVDAAFRRENEDLGVPLSLKFN